MTAVMNLAYAGEMSAVRFRPEYHRVPAGFEYFRDVQPPEPIQNLVDYYNYRVDHGGQRALFASIPEVEHAENGLSFTRFGEELEGEESEVLILIQNPFATDLSRMNRFRGQFLYDSLTATGVKGPDGKTPQVLQVASACRTTDIPLTPREHVRLAGGDNSPVADKIAEVVFDYFPNAKQIISVGYSLSGFLTPDILMSLNRGKDVLAALIANPPGVQPEHMRTILGNFEHAGAHMSEHLKSSGLHVLQPKNIASFAGKLCEKAGTIVDVIWRPTNLSLWLDFSHGKLLERVQALHRLAPKAVINFAFGYEDPLCSPLVLESFLRDSAYGAAVVEHGDHAWGMNLTRSMGQLATSQIRTILSPKLQTTSSLALAA